MSGDPFAFLADAMAPAADPTPAPAYATLRTTLPVAIRLWLHGGAIAALFGIGLLALMYAPERHRRAADRLGAGSIVSWLIGAAVLGVVLLVLARLGMRPGFRALIAVELFACAIGLSVCARVLGERVLPERSAFAQTAAGLLALVLPLASPFGVPVLLIAAPLGLGAWLRPARTPAAR